MKDTFRLKTWAGPLTIGSFVVIAGTGILMFFHLNVGLVKLAHEWLSWLLVVGAFAHLVVNWKAVVAYFRKPAGIVIMASLLVLGLLSLLPVGGSPRRPPHMDISRALDQSSLTLVAQVAKRSPQSAIDELKARGIQVRHGEQTISEIASDNEKRTMDILACLMATAGESAAAGRAGR